MWLHNERLAGDCQQIRPGGYIRLKGAHRHVDHTFITGDVSRIRAKHLHDEDSTTD